MLNTFWVIQNHMKYSLATHPFHAIYFSKALKTIFNGSVNCRFWDLAAMMLNFRSNSSPSLLPLSGTDLDLCIPNGRKVEKKPHCPFVLLQGIVKCGIEDLHRQRLRRCRCFARKMLLSASLNPTWIWTMYSSLRENDLSGTSIPFRTGQVLGLPLEGS